MKTWARALIGMFLLSILFYVVDWRESLPLILNIKPFPLAVAMLLFPVGIWISVRKWAMLLRAHGMNVGLSRLFRCYWIGIFVSNFLPSNIGGDISRVAFLRDQGRTAQVAGSVLMERLTGFVIILIFSALALVLRAHYLDGYVLVFFRLFVASGMVFMVAAFFFGGVLSDWISRFSFSEDALPGLIVSKLQKILLSTIFYHQRAGLLFEALIWSLVFFGVSVYAQYLLFDALGLDMPLLEVMFIAPLINLVSFVPISINAVGLTEGAFVFFYSGAGLVPSEALAVAIVARFFRMIVSSFGGGFLILHKR